MNFAVGISEEFVGTCIFFPAVLDSSVEVIPLTTNPVSLVYLDPESHNDTIREQKFRTIKIKWVCDMIKMLK